MNDQVTLVYDEANLNELLQQKEVVILYFTTPTCNVCKAVFPRLQEMLEDYPTVPLLKIDAASLVELAAQHLVFTVPTILVMNQGKEVLRESRFIDYMKIDRILSLLLN